MMLRVPVEFLRVLNTPCREHARLIAEDVDGRVSRATHAGLRVHMVLCAPCRHLRGQLLLIKRAAARLDTAATERAIAWGRMPADVRDRLKRLLGSSPD